MAFFDGFKKVFTDKFGNINIGDNFFIGDGSKLKNLTAGDESDPVFVASQAHNITEAHITVLGNTSGTNSGDNATNTQYSSLTQYTDELAQDAVGGMVDSTLTYTDSTPELKVTNPVTPQTTGFTISAGTTPKTLTVADTASVTGTNTGDVPPSIGMAITEDDTSLAVADGKVALSIPATLNNYNLTAGLITVHDKGVTGSTTIQFRRRRAGTDADMLTDKLTIGDAYSSTTLTVNTSNDDVQTGDAIYIDIDTVHSTPPKGGTIVLTFTK